MWGITKERRMDPSAVRRLTDEVAAKVTDKTAETDEVSAMVPEEDRPSIESASPYWCQDARQEVMRQVSLAKVAVDAGKGFDWE